MKTQRNIARMVALASVAVMLALAGMWLSTRSAQAISDFSFSSGRAGLASGQTARIGVVNTGSEDVQVRLSLVDEGGKVQFLCDQVVAAGTAHFDDFQHPGGANRLELRGVVVVREAANRKEAERVMPSLQVFDTKTGKTTMMVGRDGFSPFQG